MGRSEGLYRRQIANHHAVVRTQIVAIERYQAVMRDLTVVDPACGSGAFLIYALEYLLREHRRAASEHGQRTQRR